MCNKNHNAPERDCIFNVLFMPHLEINSNIRFYFTVMNYLVFWTINTFKKGWNNRRGNQKP